MDKNIKTEKFEKSKIIAVWGNDGVSCLTQILAKELSGKDKKQIIVINNDKVIPMQSVWHPQKKVNMKKSIGLLLANREINTTVVAESLEIYEPYQEIATLGYCEGNNELTEKEVAPYSTYLQIIKAAGEIADYVLIDCTKNITNLLSVAALEVSDVVVLSLTADVKGAIFWKNNLSLLSQEKFNNEKFLAIANLTVPYNDIKTFSEIIGKVHAVLPYSLQVHEGDIDGESFNLSSILQKKYRLKLNVLLSEVDRVLKIENNKFPPQKIISGGIPSEQ